MFTPKTLIAAYLGTCPPGVASIYRGSVHFDFFYAYTQGHKKPSDMVATQVATERTALWLTSYLAHWGMFRGSSQLGKLNIRYFTDLLPALLSEKDGILTPLFGVQFDKLHEIDNKVLTRLLQKFSSLLKPNVSPTATLRSKLILGLTSSMPGYDRNFIAGLKRLKTEHAFAGPVRFGAPSLVALSKWYSTQTWPSIACEGDSSQLLPAGRLIDMALFQYGV